MTFDVKQVGDAMIAAVKAYAGTRFASIFSRLDSIESRLPAAGATKSAYASAPSPQNGGRGPVYLGPPRDPDDRIDRMEKEISALQRELSALHRKFIDPQV
jgi:hypothetical protein